MAERRAIPVYLGLEEAAEAMSVSVKTIRRWIAAGTLPAYRCGKRAIRIKLEDQEAAPSRSPQRDAEYGQAVLIVTGRDRTNRPNDQHPWQLLAGTSSELVARMLHVTWKEALERASDLRFLLWAILGLNQ